jgi:hypothetical protein
VVRRFYRQEPPLDTKHEETFYELLTFAAFNSLKLLASPRGAAGYP